MWLTKFSNFLFRAFVAPLVGSSALLVVARLDASTIYFDDFNGSGDSNLHGTAPGPGSETWSSDTPWKDNGSIASPFASPAHAYLPFVPSAGNVYALSMDMNVTGGQETNHFFSLGFSATNTLSEAYYPDGFFAFAIKRTNGFGGDQVETALGPGYSIGATHNNSGALNLKVVLDTQPSLWTVRWLVNNISIRGPVAFGSNPSINYVAFGSFQNTTGTVDNFTLTVIPEPTSSLAACAGVVGLIACGRRRQRRKE